ncbi:polyprenyl diphosphate synthase [Amylibacter sp.]|jgi:undecaprenyl diphosphate synthase|nr:polyprenyl diphosphate synthase [Amylibacter sp.]MDA9304889.1 polyprenyl diphosphate synthase [Amylibacter sp.]MDC1376143.1 polyprenyl diphosphate synthase [Amylibacter sp.]
MKIEKKIKPENLHVAIVMDGNGRWANERALARLKGHAKGADRVRHIVRASLDMNVTHLTLFAFSTENWKRSESEVVGLMGLFKKFMKSEAKKLLINGVKVRFIGDRSRLDKSLIKLMDELELLTIANNNLHLTIALNYGGRDEIVRATKKISEKVKLGVLKIDDITVEMFSNNLDTFDLPDPDLVIRTSGEVRTSNFLPWQCAYSEYVFEKTNWPDFNNDIYDEILIEFKNRERRFGAILKK